MPTGLVSVGEDLHEAAEREVWEETGIRGRFAAVLAVRQAHALAFGKSDLFFVCALTVEPGQAQISIQARGCACDVEQLVTRCRFGQEVSTLMLRALPARPCVAGANGSCYRLRAGWPCRCGDNVAPVLFPHMKYICLHFLCERG